MTAVKPVIPSAMATATTGSRSSILLMWPLRFISWHAEAIGRALYWSFSSEGDEKSRAKARWCAWLWPCQLSSFFEQWTQVRHVLSGSWALMNVGLLMSPRFGVWRWLERNSQDTYFADLAACSAYVDQPQALEKRVLVIVGSEDKMTAPRAGR